MNSVRPILALSLALFALTALDASAQMRGGTGRAARPAAARAASAASETSRVNAPEEVIEELRQDLHLRPDQARAWDDYIGKVEAMRLDIARENQRSRSDPGTNALKRIDRSVEVAQDRLAALEEIAAAAKKLYALLDAPQQQIADARLAAVIPAAFENAAARGAPPRTRPEGR